jgi:hypothetical protein
MADTCLTCAFWDNDTPGWEPEWASCKRFPPTTARINRTCPKQIRDYEFCYPTTHQDQFCGEYAKKLPTPP